jgi:hypothetical protein
MDPLAAIFPLAADWLANGIRFASDLEGSAFSVVASQSLAPSGPLVLTAEQQHDVVVEGARLAKDLTEQLITLSLALLGFTMTFLTEILKRHPSRGTAIALVAAWLGHLAAIIAGLTAFMGLTGTLLPGNGPTHSLVDVAPAARGGAMAQLLFFALGTIALCLFGWLSLRAGKPKELYRAE